MQDSITYNINRMIVSQPVGQLVLGSVMSKLTTPTSFTTTCVYCMHGSSTGSGTGSGTGYGRFGTCCAGYNGISPHPKHMYHHNITVKGVITTICIG